MKIRYRLSIFFTLFTIVWIVTILFIFYRYASSAMIELYDASLKDYADSIAKTHRNQNKQNALDPNETQWQYDTVLPDIAEIIIPLDLPASTDSLTQYLSPQQIEKVLKGNPQHFKWGKQSGIALFYPGNPSDFVIILLSEANYRAQIHKQLLSITAILLIVSSLLLMWVGRLYTLRMLSPLQDILKSLKRVKGNRLDVRINPTGSKDEFDELILSLNKMLDRINDAFYAEQAFISNASHELNNPITAIQGECEITLLKQRSTEEYIESLTRISTESKRLTNLIRHLLFLSRQKVDLLNNIAEEIDPAVFVKDLCMGNERLRFDHTKWTNNDVRILANPYLLHVAIQNVIDNACKYSGNKPVDVRIFQENGKAVVQVEDYGIGIPEEDMKHIFQSFYRASNSRGYAGNGVGLSLTSKITTIYADDIKIESTPDKGTKVSIWFPVNP